MQGLRRLLPPVRVPLPLPHLPLQQHLLLRLHLRHRRPRLREVHRSVQVGGKGNSIMREMICSKFELRFSRPLHYRDLTARHSVRKRTLR